MIELSSTVNRYKEVCPTLQYGRSRSIRLSVSDTREPKKGKKLNQASVQFVRSEAGHLNATNDNWN